jgi:hypothetical protein
MQTPTKSFENTLRAVTPERKRKHIELDPSSPYSCDLYSPKMPGAPVKRTYGFSSPLRTTTRECPWAPERKNKR